jgi:hypothetical protein
MLFLLSLPFALTPFASLGAVLCSARSDGWAGPVFYLCQLVYSLSLHNFQDSIVFQSVKNHHNAEDVTATIFLKVVSGLDSTYGLIEVNFWLFQLTCTTIADYWRTRARASFFSLEALLDSGWEGSTEVPFASHDTAQPCPTAPASAASTLSRSLNLPFSAHALDSRYSTTHGLDSGKRQSDAVSRPQTRR